MGRQYLVEVNNVPDDCEEFIVATYVLGELWFWGSWDDESKAKEVANEREDRIVVRRANL